MKEEIKIVKKDVSRVKGSVPLRQPKVRYDFRKTKRAKK